MTIAALVLAAGRSTRMGSNKLLEHLNDRPLVRHVVDAALASQARPVVVVTGHQEREIRKALGSCDVSYISNPHYAEGLSTSLKAGMASLPSTCEGVLILLGDMPLIDSSLLNHMIEQFKAAPSALAFVPTYKGAWGNPVMLTRRLFDQVASLEGDAGARKLLAAHRDSVIEVPVESDSIFLDLDTPEALAQARG
jgi:molybdenum cofactor cytidylyltransferase